MLFLNSEYYTDELNKFKIKENGDSYNIKCWF